jgi:hypothetical protein
MSKEVGERIRKLLRDEAVNHSQTDINQSTSLHALWGMFNSDKEFRDYVATFDSQTAAHAFTLGFAELHGRVLKLSEYKPYIKAVKRALARLEYARDFKKKLLATPSSKKELSKRYSERRLRAFDAVIAREGSYFFGAAYDIDISKSERKNVNTEKLVAKRKAFRRAFYRFRGGEK